MKAACKPTVEGLLQAKKEGVNIYTFFFFKTSIQLSLFSRFGLLFGCLDVDRRFGDLR